MVLEVNVDIAQDDSVAAITATADLEVSEILTFIQAVILIGQQA